MTACLQAPQLPLKRSVQSTSFEEIAQFVGIALTTIRIWVSLCWEKIVELEVTEENESESDFIAQFDAENAAVLYT